MYMEIWKQDIEAQKKREEEVTGAEALITGKLREVCFPEEEKYMFEKMEEMFKRYQTAQ